MTDLKPHLDNIEKALKHAARLTREGGYQRRDVDAARNSLAAIRESLKDENALFDLFDGASPCSEG